MKLDTVRVRMFERKVKMAPVIPLDLVGRWHRVARLFQHVNRTFQSLAGNQEVEVLEIPFGGLVVQQLARHCTLQDHGSDLFRGQQLDDTITLEFEQGRSSTKIVQPTRNLAQHRRRHPRRRCSREPRDHETENTMALGEVPESSSEAGILERPAQEWVEVDLALLRAQGYQQPPSAAPKVRTRSLGMPHSVALREKPSKRAATSSAVESTSAADRR